MTTIDSDPCEGIACEDCFSDCPGIPEGRLRCSTCVHQQRCELWERDGSIPIGPLKRDDELFSVLYWSPCGWLHHEDAKPIRDVFDYVSEELQRYFHVDEYFGLSASVASESWKAREENRPDLEPLWPVDARWIAVFAVTGGSEGHYVHVDAITDAGRGDRTGKANAGLYHLFLGKTFLGMEHALDMAKHLTRILNC